MIHPSLDNGMPFNVNNSHLPDGKYRVRPGSLKEDDTVLLQRWAEDVQDWLSEGRRPQTEVLLLLTPANACAACNGTGKYPPLTGFKCEACKGTGKRTSISTVGRDMKTDNPLATKKVGRPRARITAEPNLEDAPDISTDTFLAVLKLLLRKTTTLKKVAEELNLTKRQAYHCVYWLRAFNYLQEEQDEGVRGRLYAGTSKGQKHLEKCSKKSGSKA